MYADTEAAKAFDDEVSSFNEHIGLGRVGSKEKIPNTAEKIYELK